MAIPSSPLETQYPGVAEVSSLALWTSRDPGWIRTMFRGTYGNSAHTDALFSMANFVAPPSWTTLEL